MIWTHDAILQLKEDDLTRQVLIPLFSAMGYENVRFHGGQILEQGKDMTMWRTDAAQGRRNAAAVVKAVKISGESSTTNVIAQLRQAWAAPFQDTATGASQQVHELFVITPREVTKEGALTLHNVIAAEPFNRYVTIIDDEQRPSVT
jgi:hypothetical protein